MPLYARTLDETVVRQHGEGVVKGHAPMREGPLAVAVSGAAKLAGHLLHVVGHVLSAIGLVLIATLSADIAHNLCTGAGAPTPRPPTAPNRPAMARPGDAGRSVGGGDAGSGSRATQAGTAPTSRRHIPSALPELAAFG